MGSDNVFYRELQNLLDSSKSFVLVTLIDILLSAPQEVGAKMLVTEEGLHHGTIGGGKLEAFAIKSAIQLLQSDKKHQLLCLNLKRDIGMTCGGEVSLFFEKTTINAWEIVIFGAGHVSQALVRLLLTLDCRLTVIDSREEWLAKLPDHHKLQKHCLAHPEDFVPKLTPRSFVISMTQGHAYDLPVVSQILRQFTPPYLGVIGSASKARVLKRDLKSHGIPQDLIDRIHCPIGLPLGSNTPEEIAVSVAAQLLMTRDLSI